ncbi:MAG TPA: 3' terminal RNA ribose 2'-O-methyltransferase Hen1 [Natronosporangium sp.]|nr:3' terminal RNA ribose 2'-O-methyltransferase Hen1 [Natronosporangium sp.]
MLLSITTTHRPATDLGYLLVKHPDRVHQVALSTGTAYVLFPQADPDRCTATLLLDIDPLQLTRRRWPAGGGTDLSSYVNDRPYAASSLLAVALAKVFSSAMRGVSRDRPELAATAIPLQLELPVVRCRGGVDLAHRLFTPLGWQVTATTVAANESDRYLMLSLVGEHRLADALNHLYVLLPVLDDAKHYWVSHDEIDKLLRAGANWLPEHPERTLITRRYLVHQQGMVDQALARLAALDDTLAPASEDTSDGGTAEEARLPAAQREPLAAARRAAVRQALTELGASTVVDLGCGGGELLVELLADPRYTRLVGADVSTRTLAAAQRRLRLDELPERQQRRVELWQTALTYRDDRLIGFDAAVLMEVIEHVDPPRLPAVVDAVFGHARPQAVLVTTPNREYNPRYPGLAPGELRHPDHRFEWTRAEFADWARQVASRYGYRLELREVGEPDPEVGAPTQLAVFTRDGAVA